MNCNCDCAGCAESCDCQRCTTAQTELLAPPHNRPGLDAINGRIGDYGEFYADAIRQLSSARSPHLQGLGTRDPSDPTIALLDAWSLVADVLTFYRERLTQEGYLRTAVDPQSLRELANMVGFKPRPGIAATAHLAYVLDRSAAPVDIDAGAKAQTVPLPGERMQTFETDALLTARAEWSQMKPRLTRPPNIDFRDALIRKTLRLADSSLVVRPGERILFVFGNGVGRQIAREVASATTNYESGYVELTLKPRDGRVQALFENDHSAESPLLDFIDRYSREIERSIPASRFDALQMTLTVLGSYLLGASAAETRAWLRDRRWEDGLQQERRGLAEVFENVVNVPRDEHKEIEKTDVDGIFASIRESARRSRPSSGKAARNAAQGLDKEGPVRVELAQALAPTIRDSLTSALRQRPANPKPATVASVYLLRTVASPFGATAPMQYVERNWRDWPLEAAEKAAGSAFLDGVVDGIAAGSFAVVSTPLKWTASEGGEVTPDRLYRFAQVSSTQTLQRGGYNISSKVTKLRLVDPKTGAAFPVIPSGDD